MTAKREHQDMLESIDRQRRGEPSPPSITLPALFEDEVAAVPEWDDPGVGCRSQQIPAGVAT